MNIGSNIRAIRKEKGYTQKDLAEKMGLSEISIKKYESSKSNLTISTLERIVNALNVDITDVFKDDNRLCKEEIVHIIESIKLNIKRYENVIYVMADNDVLDGRDIIIGKIEALDNIVDKLEREL